MVCQKAQGWVDLGGSPRLPLMWARLPHALLSLMLLGLVWITGTAQDTPAPSADVSRVASAPGAVSSSSDAKPITVYADVVQGWSEEAHHGLYARGNVSIERGLTQIGRAHV